MVGEPQCQSRTFKHPPPTFVRQVVSFLLVLGVSRRPSSFILVHRFPESCRESCIIYESFYV